MFNEISSDGKGKIIELLLGLTESIEKITEFSESELKAISILESDEYLRGMLDYYKSNKKHVHRKHSKELLEALKSIAKTLEEKPVYGGKQ